MLYLVCYTVSLVRARFHFFLHNISDFRELQINLFYLYFNSFAIGMLWQGGTGESGLLESEERPWLGRTRAFKVHVLVCSTS